MRTEVMAREVVRGNRRERIARSNQYRGTHESVERNSVDSLPIVEKMFRGIDVRSCMRPERDAGDVRSSAFGYRLLWLYEDFGIAGVDDATRADWNRNVVDAGHYDGRLVDSLALRTNRGMPASNMLPSARMKL